MVRSDAGYELFYYYYYYYYYNIRYFLMFNNPCNDKRDVNLGFHISYYPFMYGAIV